MLFSAVHTDANAEGKPKMTGSFEFDYETKEMTLTVNNANAKFEDVLFAFEQCRDEFQRQIDNMAKCPFHKGSN